MHKKFLNSLFRFLLVFSLTIVTIAGLSRVSRLYTLSQKDSGTYIEANTEPDAQPNQEISAVVHTETNIFPSVAAFLLLASIPTVYLLFLYRKRKKEPEYFHAGAQRYSPKEEITFNNNALDTDYNRSRM